MSLIMKIRIRILSILLDRCINTSLHAYILYLQGNIYDELCYMLRRYDKPSKSIPGQVNLLSQIGGLNYWFIHPYKKLSQIGGLFS